MKRVLDYLITAYNNNTDNDIYNWTAPYLLHVSHDRTSKNKNIYLMVCKYTELLFGIRYYVKTKKVMKEVNGDRYSWGGFVSIYDMDTFYRQIPPEALAVIYKSKLGGRLS